MLIEKKDHMSFEYWNNIEIEKTKPYWVEDESDLKFLHFIQEETNLLRCFQEAVMYAEQFGGVRGHVLDVGAGVAWTSALISGLDKVDSVTSTDYSEHRLKKIAPIIFKQLSGNEKKFNPVVGDFLKLEFQADHYQTVIFCQSLYMFPDINKVLEKVSRLLAPDGIIMIVCERITPEFQLYSINGLRRILKRLLKRRQDSTGNYFYNDKEYHNAIVNSGFTYKFQLLDYPVYPGSSTLKAGNHFGIKTNV